MDIFKFFRKKKAKHLNLVEYDKLVDSKLAKIRAFVKQHVSGRDDDEMFQKEFEEAFNSYVDLIKNEISTYKPGKEITLSPISVLHLFNQTYRRKKKVVWYKRFFRFIKSIKVYVVLFVKDQFLRRELRKIKKLFPDYKMSNDRAMNLLMGVKLNKRMLAKKL